MLLKKTQCTAKIRRQNALRLPSVYVHTRVLASFERQVFLVSLKGCARKTPNGKAQIQVRPWICRRFRRDGCLL